MQHRLNEFFPTFDVLWERCVVLWLQHHSMSRSRPSMLKFVNQLEREVLERSGASTYNFVWGRTPHGGAERQLLLCVLVLHQSHKRHAFHRVNGEIEFGIGVSCACPKF